MNFFKWLSNKQKLDSKKESVYNQMKTIWEESTKIPSPQIPNTDESWEKLACRIKATEKEKQHVLNNFKPVMILRSRYALAAACSIILILSSIFIVNQRPVSYSIGPAKQRTLTLPDSSIVILNCKSRLVHSKRFNQKIRTVTLKGEAYFKVKKGNFPFIIKTEQALIKVIGTEFNIKSRENRIEVGVIQGIVKMTSQKTEIDSAITLKKGEYTLCYQEQYPQEPQPIQFAQYPGWMYGNLTFNQTKLDQVIEEIERQFDVSIRLQDRYLENISITGLFEGRKLENILNSICALIQKEYRYENKTYIIY